MSRVSLTAIVLAHNEEIHIERCIGSLKDCAGRVVVIDSHSTDRTVELARKLGADIYQRPFRNYADQFNWALEHCAITSDWVMRIDADEYVDTVLAREVTSRLPQLRSDVTGAIVNRQIKFFSRTIRYGGISPQLLLKIWRTGKGRVENRWMDEHTVLSEGAAVIFSGQLIDENLKDMSFWIDKHNRYATREMIDFINLQHKFYEEKDLFETAREARLKRRAKMSLYNRAPLLYRAVLFFFYRYAIRLGFLDGTAGLLFHLMQGLWYRLLVDMKILEAQAFIKRHGIEAFKAMLDERYRISL